MALSQWNENIATILRINISFFVKLKLISFIQNFKEGLANSYKFLITFIPFVLSHRWGFLI